MDEQQNEPGGRWTVVDTLYWLGALLISTGVGWLCPPAGLISGGVLVLLGAFLIDRAGGRGDGR